MARTGELTPPGISDFARRKRTLPVASVMRPDLQVTLWYLPPSRRSARRLVTDCYLAGWARARDRSEPGCELLRPVRHDQVGARAPDGGQRLERGLPLVEPAVLRGRLHHRVLARDVVRGDRQVEALADRSDDVQVRQRGLDHQRVGALAHVELALADRLAHVAGIHLVAAAIAERRRRL